MWGFIGGRKNNEYGHNQLTYSANREKDREGGWGFDSVQVKCNTLKGG